ncbi:MAG: hypothetical protein ACREIV_14315, partial [Planctomycetaceae bacterium]
FVAAAVTLAMTPVARTEVLIGSAAPLTGQMSWHGEQHQRAVELAVAELKNAGGVLGENACHVKIAGYRRGAAQAPNPL